MARKVHVRSAKRQMTWIGIRITPQVLTGTTPLLLGSMNAAALALRPFTIVRTRMNIWVASDQAAVSETNSGAYAMQVVTEQATGAGVTAVPTPGSEFNADYFVYQPFQFDFVFLSSVGIYERTGEGSGYTIDSKAMRKVDVDDDLSMTAQMDVATVGAIITGNGRMLVKLH